MFLFPSPVDPATLPVHQHHVVLVVPANTSDRVVGHGFASQQEEGHSISLAVEFPAVTAAESEGSADVADWEQQIDMSIYIYLYTHVQMYLHTTVLMLK